MGPRIFSYLTLTVALLISFLISSKFNWHGSVEANVLMEVTSLVLAFVIGILALIKFFTRTKRMYLFVGVGFLGASLLEVFQLTLISRFFLSAFSFMSWLVWNMEREKAEKKIPFMVLIFLLFFSLVFRDTLGIVSSVLFFLALVGYLSKGFWKAKYFEYFFIMFLIVSIAEDVFFNSAALSLYSSMPNLAHILKIVGYSFCLTGLFMSVYISFKEELNAKRKLTNQNELLEKVKLEIEKKRDQLAYQRDQANLIISSMGEGLLVIDRDYKISLMNPASEKLLGIPKIEAVGKLWSDIVAAYEGDIKIPFDERTSTVVIKTGKTIVTKLDDDHYYKTIPGQKFPLISITGPLRSNGEIIGAVKVFRDATSDKDSKRIIEEKVKERTRELEKARDRISAGWLQLQEEKARLTASINNLPLGFFIIDTSHNILILNPAMEDILDYAPKRWKFDILAKLLKKSSVDLKDLCAHCRGDKNSFGLDEVPYNNKILRIISVPIILPEKNEVIGTAVVIDDITEAKLLERSKDEFFAVASHELRTPLTAIRGNTSLIQQYFSDKVKDSDLEEMISDIYSSSIRLIDIVNDFLDVSRLEQGKIEFNKERVDIPTLVAEISRELEAKVKEKNLYLKVEIEDKDLPQAIGDKGRIKQILVNLLGNSINFTNRGGIEIKVSKNKKFVKVGVSDTGRGILVQNQRLLFKKFQQAGERVLARDVTQGTGMGLYISKLLCEGMGGKIWVEKSEAGKGSTFAFEIPIAI